MVKGCGYAAVNSSIGEAIAQTDKTDINDTNSEYSVAKIETKRTFCPRYEYTIGTTSARQSYQKHTKWDKFNTVGQG